MSGVPSRDVINQFIESGDLRKADKAYFKEVLIGIEDEQRSLEEKFEPFLDRKLEELDLIERSILLLGVYELVHSQEVPWRVVINESVELAKIYGADQAYKYINGILDRAAKPLRPLETA